jgi:hypothetical protein
MTKTTASEPKIASIRQGFLPGFTLYAGRIEHKGKSFPLNGVHAEVSSAGGAFGGSRFLTISGPGFSWSQRSDAFFEGRARKFAATVNAQATAAAQ